MMEDEMMMPPQSAPPQGAFGALKQRTAGAAPLGAMLSGGMGGASEAPIENPLEASPPWFGEDGYGGGTGMGMGMDMPPGPMGAPASPNADFDRRQQMKDDMVMLLQQRAKARSQSTDKFQRYAEAAARGGNSGPLV